MPTNTNSGDRLRSVLVTIATIGTIVLNGLTGVGKVNGVTPEMISDKYPTVMTPAGWGFSIWLLIFIGLLAFSVYQMLPANLERFRRVRLFYIISCVLNCAWIFFFPREQIGVCLLIIVALLFTLITILNEFRRSGDQTGSFLTKTVFGLYTGWVTAVMLVNLAIFLKYVGVGFSATVWNVLGVCLLLLAAGFAVIVRFKLGNYLYPLAIAWAATAIAIKQSGNTSIVVASSLCVIVGLVMAVSFVMDQKSTTT